MMLGVRFYSYILCFSLLATASQSAMALLNQRGQGTAEDRSGLVLLYTFDESNSTDIIYNQVKKSNAADPTHLRFQGVRNNMELKNGSLFFNSNAVLTFNDQRYLSRALGQKIGSVVVNLESKKAIGRKVIPNRAYLKSQSPVSFSSLCPSDDQMTLQIFHRPSNANFVNHYDRSKRYALRPNVFALRPLNEYYGSFFSGVDSSRKSMNNSVKNIFHQNRRDDLYYNGEINESIMTFKAGDYFNSYHKVYSEAGTQGWTSFESKAGNLKVPNSNSSHLLLGFGYFPGGESVAAKNQALQAATSDAVVKNLVSAFATGYVGEVLQVALYCRQVTRAEVLDGEFINTTKIKVTPELNSEPTQSERVAVRLLSLITKKKIPIDAGIVKEAAAFIAKGDYQSAARIGIELPDFYNNTVKDFALRMSNREESVDAPLNDMTATLVGIVRDELDARLMLTGDFYYKANPLAGVPSDVRRHMLLSNIHYDEIEKRGLDLKKVLVRENEQKILSDAASVTKHPDPAGVLSSRAFLSAHAVAGTNRRQVEYAFKQFMCVDLADMADTKASDLRVGRDIDRFPAGSNKKYQTSCKGCHSVMDGFRGAFAKTDFDILSNFVKHTAFFPSFSKRVSGKSLTYPRDVHYKVNHNEFSFPSGYVTNDDSFQNYANRGANKILFGWRGPASKGFGMGQFGKMLSNSERFSKCMVKRVFESICPVKVSEETLAKLQLYVLDFEKNKYDLKKLYMQAAVSPLCLGSN